VPNDVLAVQAARPDLTLQHIKLPQQYLEAAYPLMHAAISQDRQDIAVAGTRGLAVYSRAESTFFFQPVLPKKLPGFTACFPSR
jgi:hypothetical protein